MAETPTPPAAPPPGEQTQPPRFTSLERIVAGCLGGLFALIAKYLGQDHQAVVAALVATPAPPLDDIVIGYSIMAPILLLLGGALAWASEDEKSRIKLIAIGVAAPALITTWAGGGKSPPERIAALDAPTYTETAWRPDANLRLLQGGEEWPEVERESPIWRGIKHFFNAYEVRYWVVVASFLSRARAEAFADRVRDYPPMRQAYIGFDRFGLAYIPVFAAPGEPLEDARRRLAAVEHIPLIARNDPFIVAY
jgi:hypothetical protein